MSVPARPPVQACSAALALVWVCCSTQAAEAPATASLCAKGETVYFSCTVARGRLLSLCGKLPASLQYRFGTRQRMELSYPEAARDGSTQFFFAHYFRYQTERTTLRFENAGTEYLLFDNSEDGKRQAGVSVRLPGQAEGKDVLCRGPVQSRLPRLKPHLRCDAESALSGGDCK